MPNDIEVIYQEVYLDDIINYYMRGFKKDFLTYEYWLDVNKREVVLKMLLRKEAPDEQGD